VVSLNVAVGRWLRHYLTECFNA